MQIRAIIIVVIFGILPFSNEAQQNLIKIPVTDVPSPYAAQFMRYGEIPVGHTTGIPQIEVPLYTIKTGVVDIPITLTYHASGFRVNDVASPAGLGWVLNAGGMISRTVMGAVDEQAIYSLGNVNTITTEEELNKVKNGEKLISGVDLSNSQNAEELNYLFFNTGDNPNCDERSDKYFYSFIGHVGNAQYNNKNVGEGLQTIPYEPLKFESIKNGYNVYFVVTDTKGVKYTFQDTEYNLNKTTHKGKVVGSWYLTKIVFPGIPDEVTFTYEEGTMYQVRTVEQVIRCVGGASVLWGETQERSCKGKAAPPLYVGVEETYEEPKAYNQYVYNLISCKPKLLKEIKFKDVSVRFNYSKDRKDAQRKNVSEQLDRLTSVVVSNKQETIEEIKFNNNVYFGTQKENYRLKLTGIDFVKEGGKYTFTYNESLNAQLPQYYYYMSHVNCTEDFWGYWNGTSSEYVFHNGVIKKYENIIKRYVNGSDISKKTTSRLSSESHTKACVLTDIKYPTKGKTHFEYSLNEGSFSPSNISNPNNKLGGLRVVSVKNYDENNLEKECKTYSYSDGRTIFSENALYFEDYFHNQTQLFDIYTELGINDACICDIIGKRHQLLDVYNFYSSPFCPLSGLGGTPVFYQTVTEYFGTPTSNNGSIEYNYGFNREERGSEYTWEGSHMPQSFIASIDCDYGYDKGQLISEIVLDASGNRKYSKEMNYSTFTNTIKTGLRLGLYVELDSKLESNNEDTDPYFAIGVYGGGAYYKSYVLQNIIGKQTYAYQTVKQPIKMVEKWYDDKGYTTTKTTEYAYCLKSNGSLTSSITGLLAVNNPLRTSVTNSNGSKYEDEVLLPCYYSYKSQSVYNEMCKNMMYEYPVTIQRKVDGMIKEYTDYSFQKFNNSFYAPISISQNGDKRIDCKNYDSRGNLIYAIKDGAQHIVCIYSYNYSYPVFKIEGATLAQVEKIISQNGYSSVENLGASYPTATTIENIGAKLRSGLALSAMVDTYTYAPLVGITTHIDCRGAKQTYEYDSGGRLVNIFEHNGSNKYLLQHFDYNYSNK